jgi:hypothetical protein
MRQISRPAFDTGSPVFRVPERYTIEYSCVEFLDRLRLMVTVSLMEVIFTIIQNRFLLCSLEVFLKSSPCCLEAALHDEF